MLQNWLKIFLLFCLLINLTSCGFKLGPRYSLPDQLNYIYIETNAPYSSFILALKRELKINKKDVIDAAKNANFILKVISFDFNHNWVNVYSSTQANVYTFNMVVIFKINDIAEKNILPATEVKSSRFLKLNPNELLATSNQVGILEQEMLQEIIDKIFFILSSKQIHAHLS